MKRFLKCMCLVMAAVLLLSVPVFAAEEEAITYGSAYIAVTDQYLWRVSDTEVQVWFEVLATRGMDQLGTSLIKVQRSSDNVNWTTMQTYTPESDPQMLCPDTSAHTECVSYTYTSGYYYRAFVTFYATNSRGTGKYSAYTPVMYL